MGHCDISVEKKLVEVNHTMTQNRPFQQMTQLYDATYKNKDYAGEAALLHKIIKHYSPKATSLLDIGCGTGAHIKYLSALGYTCSGVDRSSKMLSIAKSRLASVDPPPILLQKDARFLKLNKTYDVVVSLFHVTSYMTTDGDLDKYFGSVVSHLTHGIFIFDLWYGPGVLSSRPETRYKLITTPFGVVHKIKVPTIFPEKNIVNVMHLAILETPGKRGTILKEKHTLRYFFYPEIKALLSKYGFKILAWGSPDWPLKKSNLNDWNTLFVCKKI